MNVIDKIPAKAGLRPLARHDPQERIPQVLEDLSTAYWHSEILFTAVELDLFSALELDGATCKELSTALAIKPAALGRFLDALVTLGLVGCHGTRYFNTQVSRNCLIRNSAQDQRASILWRKQLRASWSDLTTCLRQGGRCTYPQNDTPATQATRIQNYLRAMDCVAATKATEILHAFKGVSLRGRLLDVGAGSGALSAAFLKQFPSLTATLLDLKDVLVQTRSLLKKKSICSRIRYCAGNILEPWPVRKKSFDAILLSNILHAYSEQELPHILGMATAALKPNGLLIIHDFFPEHQPIKAALADLNMFINTYNGKILPASHVRMELQRLGVAENAFMPLPSDTAVLFASRKPATIRALAIDTTSRLESELRALGFTGVHRLAAHDIRVADWPGLKCQFGCEKYGTPHCPPNSPTPAMTRRILKDFRQALLLEGEPPTRDFQTKIVQAERLAFVAGFHKALAFWAGPCSLCKQCVTDGKCRNPTQARPAMEAAGIDVFGTVRHAGISLRTLATRSEHVKYFGLLLLD